MESFLELWLLTRMGESQTLNNRYTSMASLMPLDIEPGVTIQEFLNKVQNYVNEFDLHDKEARFRLNGKEIFLLFAVDIDNGFDLVLGDEPLEDDDPETLDYFKMVEDTEDEGLFGCGC